MQAFKKLSSLVLSLMMIVALIPASVFADPPPTHFTDVVLNADNFPDPKFRESITKLYGVAEGDTLNYDAAVQKKKRQYELEFETANFTGFNYIADIIKGTDKKYPFTLDVTAPRGNPFPFELVKDVRFGTVVIQGNGDKYQILDYSQIYKLNDVEVLRIIYGNEEEQKTFDFSRFSDEFKGKLKGFGIASAAENGDFPSAAENPFILDLKSISDLPKLGQFSIRAYRFDLKDGLQVSNNPKLRQIILIANTDKVDIKDCPKLRNILLDGTYRVIDKQHCLGIDDMKKKPGNEFGKYMPLEVLDVSGCVQKRINVETSFTNLKEIKTSPQQQLWVRLREGSASIPRDDYPWLTNISTDDVKFSNPHYEMPLKRDPDGKLYFDLNDSVGKDNLGNVDFSSSINSTNGFTWDPSTGHFTIGDSISGIKGINYVYKSSSSKRQPTDPIPHTVFLDYINQKPEVVLRSDIKNNTITINKGTVFKPTMYARVKDVEDNKGPRPIDEAEITHNVNTDVIGEYQVTYVAKDSGNLESDPVTLKVKVEEDPAVAQLNQAKQNAKADLTKDITDYDAFKDVLEVKTAVSKGETAIDGASNKDEVVKVAKAEKEKIAKAVKEAKAKAEAKKLSEAKEKKIAEIKKVVLGVDETKYTSESLDAAKEKLDGLKKVAKAQVEKATTIDAVNAVSVNVDEAKKALVTKEAASNAKVKAAEEKAAELRAIATEKKKVADKALEEAKKAKENAKDNKAKKAALKMEEEALDKEIEAINADLKATEEEATAAQVKANEFNTPENVDAANKAKKLAEDAKTNSDKHLKSAGGRKAEISKETKALDDAIEAEEKLAKLKAEGKKPGINPGQKGVEKPKGLTASTQLAKRGAPKTGDSYNIAIWLVLILSLLLIIYVRRKKL